MKKQYLFLGLLLLLLFGGVSCNSDKKEKEKSSINRIQKDAPTKVKTMPLKTVDFMHEIVSNGKITARTVAELKFQTSETIAHIYIRNGSHVKPGQPIASLETYALNNQMEQAKDALDRSRLELHDILIGLGYKLDSLGSVPPEVMNIAKIKSGFNSAQTQYNKAIHEVQRATLTAPVGGVIANLSATPYSLSSPSTVFCNIIDTHNLEVQFSVLENELGFLNVGDDVKVSPFPIPELEIKGKISEINPWVDKNGMIQVKATIGYHPRLVGNMNVRVSAFRTMGKQWVVPKSAVVLRTGKQVVFMEAEGKAIWNYVQIGLENATSYTITSETLKEGDPIIISGNINLAHESPVVVLPD